jgi:hypothetical protein
MAEALRLRLFLNSIPALAPLSQAQSCPSVSKIGCDSSRPTSGNADALCENKYKVFIHNAAINPIEAMLKEDE